MNKIKIATIVLSLLAIFLLVVIIWPEISSTTNATNDQNTHNINQSSEEITKEAIEKDKIEEESSKEDSRTLNSTTEINGVIFNVSNEITTPNVEFDLKYWNYLLSYNYLMVIKDSADVKNEPNINSQTISQFPKYSKLNYIQTLNSDSKWYKVSWMENGLMKEGYVIADATLMRAYQFDKTKLYLDTLIAASEKGNIGFISNYKNVNGYPPYYKGSAIDAKGNRRSQSAPGYKSEENQSEFDYLPDGTLIRILSESAKNYKASLIDDSQTYYIPKRYVKMPNPLFSVEKAVIIDRNNQNEIVFEKTYNNGWKVISYTQATTGMIGKYHQPTPLGYYYGIEKRERFYYYEDGTTRIQGYAPYSIRFSGGAYIHGVPVNYRYISGGAKLDPGKIEYSKTIGTVPLSHKCVRNYTSHAKFLYEWYEAGKTAVIVME